MRRQLAIATAAIVLAMVLAACGSDGDIEPSGASETSIVVSPSVPAPDGAPPAPVADLVELDADVASRIDAGPITWSIEVTNVSDAPAVVTFPTTQTGDAVIRDRDDAIVHRSSDGQFFAQQTQSITLAPDETAVFEVGDDLSGVEPGSYELTLALTAVGPPEPFTKRIRVLAPDA